MKDKTEKDKIMKAKLILMGLALLVAVQLPAQVDRTKAPKAGPAPALKLGKYESFALKNGLKVFVVENRKLPRVSFSLVLDHGPLLEGDKAGYARLAGVLLRAGTTNRPKDQIDEEIDFIGASFSTSSTDLPVGYLMSMTYISMPSTFFTPTSSNFTPFLA